MKTRKSRMEPVSKDSSLMRCCNREIDYLLEQEGDVVFAVWECGDCGRIAYQQVGKVIPEKAVEKDKS